jgi:sodium-dependent dicarboxylate transporter 2/3/5
VLTSIIVARKSVSLSMLAVICSILGCAFTNVMSNVATANILLPSIACVGPTRGQHPLVMMMPVALSISLALLLPIGTPPNAIVLSNGNITLKQMATTGALCTIVFMVVNMCYCLFLVPLIFGEAHLQESILEACGIDSAE